MALTIRTTAHGDLRLERTVENCWLTSLQLPFASLQEISTTVVTMASLAEQPYQSLFPPQQHNDDFTSYPEPPTATFASGSPAGLRVGADAPFGSNSYSAVVTTTGSLEATLYRTSPATTHFEDGDMRLSSSSLSSASVPSAPSSVVGSPQSNHGQLGLPEWHSHAVHTQPSIVGNDYMAGAEFFTGPGMDEFGAFDFGGPPHKPFVGMFFPPFFFFLFRSFFWSSFPGQHLLPGTGIHSLAPFPIHVPPRAAWSYLPFAGVAFFALHSY